jgi:hypothetical protein
MTILISINLLSLGFHYINPNNWREDWRGAVNFIETNAKPDDIVLFEFNEPFAPWEWYSNGKVQALGARNKNVGKAIAGKKGVLYFEYLADVTDPEKQLFNDLRDMNFKRETEYSFRGVGTITYLRREIK